LFKKDGQDVGGLMQQKEPGGPSQRIAYVHVEDVDAGTSRAADLAGRIVLPARDIPTVGRIAVVLDPQEAPIGLFRPFA
jgi:predicted enzyme related to lactoylglutathione lyase